MKTWKSNRLRRRTVCRNQLQWGHVNEDVEKLGQHCDWVNGVALQWGHVNEDVEKVVWERHHEAMTRASMGPRQ